MVTSTDTVRPAVDASRRASGATVLQFGVLLTLLVIGVVPIVALLAGTSPLVPLVVALLGYAAVAVISGNVVPGTVAAVPVLATVNADVPLYQGPSQTVALGVVLGDAAVGAAILLLLGWQYSTRSSRTASSHGSGRQPSESRRSGNHRSGSLARRIWRTLGWPGTFLTAFAAWALAGALFAARDPQTAAAFGLSQFRYVVYFAVAAGLVAVGYADLRSLTGAFVVAVFGHAGFALAQFANGDTFGLTVLGETYRHNQLAIVVLDYVMPMGRFLGGLVGNNGAFATLALPVVAVLVWLAVATDRQRTRRYALLGVAVLGVLCIPLSQYDSVTVGFVATAGLAAALAGLPHWPEPYGGFVRRHRGLALLVGLGATAAGLVVVALVGVLTVLEILPVVGPRNMDTRLADYQTAFELALQYPLFGYGGGNVEPVGTELGFTGDLAIHSIAFSYLAETGFVGVALWLAAVLAVAVRAVRLAWSEHREAAVAAALCVGAVGFLTVAMLDQIWDNHTSMGVFWLFAGAIAGSYRTLRR